MATNDSKFAQIYRQALASNIGFLGLFGNSNRARTSDNNGKIVSDNLTRIDINSRLTAKNTIVLPGMARDMNSIRLSMQKIVASSEGKASMFFKTARERESAYESQFKKQSMPTKTDDKGRSVEGQKGIFGSILKFLDGVLKFILSPSILKTLLVAGIAGTIFNFLNEDTKESIRNFLKNILIGLFNGITTTFREIKNLLSDPEVKRSFQTAIQAIFDTIVAGFKLALSTKVNTPLGEFNLVTVLAGVIGSFVALKAAIATLVSAILRSSGKLILGGTTGRQRRGNRRRPRASGSARERGRIAGAALLAFGVGSALVEGYDALFGEDENDIDSNASEDMQGVPGTTPVTPGEIRNPTTFDNIATGGLLGLQAAGSASIARYGISKLPSPPTGSVPRTPAPVRPMTGPTPGFLTPFGELGQARDRRRELEKNKNMLEKIASLIKKIGEKIGPLKLVGYMWSRLRWRIATKLSVAVAGIVAAPSSAGLSLLITALGVGLLARDLYEIYDFLTTLEKEIDSENTTSPQRIDASAASSATPTSPTIVTSEPRDARAQVEEFLQKQITDEEYSAFLKAVSAEASSNAQERAAVATVILNRAKIHGNNIIAALNAPKQFQAITGPKGNQGSVDNPWSSNARRIASNVESDIAANLSKVNPTLTEFRSMNVGAWKDVGGESRMKAHLSELQNRGGTAIGQQMFASGPYRGSTPRSIAPSPVAGTPRANATMPSPIAAAPKTNLPETAPETSIFADLEKMLGAVFTAIGNTNNAVQAAVAAAARPAQQTANGPIPTPYDSQLFETLLRHHTELGSSISGN